MSDGKMLDGEGVREVVMSLFSRRRRAVARREGRGVVGRCVERKLWRKLGERGEERRVVREVVREAVMVGGNADLAEGGIFT